MKIYLNCTANLGDFVQSLPVLSGMYDQYGKLTFIIRKEMKKFLGIKEFLMYQGIFEDILYDDEIIPYGNIYILSSWTREDKNNPNRPIETCRYENWLKDNYGFNFEVNDSFLLKYPTQPFILDQSKYIVGDRWNGPEIDARRKTNVLAFLEDTSKFSFLDYKNKSLLENCYIIGTSNKPFITNFTGIGMIADLMNKESYVVWSAEDWNPEFRNGDDVVWDNGKNIEKVFEKHFYLNRKAKLVHKNDLYKLIV